MRTIKFRGKRAYGGADWKYGNLCGATHCIIEEIIEDKYREKTYWTSHTQVIPETVGQFTGLWDKNGREIYEGDILKVYYYGKSKVFGVVRFDDARFYIDDEFQSDELRVKGPMTKLFARYQFEVIGNIHDNPELLKGDRTMTNELIKEGKDERIGWLNSLDEKFASTESAWSEEDEILHNQKE